MKRIIGTICRHCKKNYLYKDVKQSVYNFKKFCSIECQNIYANRIAFKKDAQAISDLGGRFNRKKKRIYRNSPIYYSNRIKEDMKRRELPGRHLSEYEIKSIAFLKSKEWRKLRMEAFALYGNICMCCGARPPKTILHVDHIQPRLFHPELWEDINNLQILCEDCNMGKGAHLKTDFRPKT